MQNRHLLKRGLLPLLICLSVASCAPIPAAIKTETVKVNVPVFVPIPAGLTAYADMPVMPTNLTNGSLASYVLALQNALKIDINKLQEINKLQPK